MHLGQKIKDQRKALAVSSQALSEICGISRMTLHRVEQGQDSVNIGAYQKVLEALKLKFVIVSENTPAPANTQVPVPAKIYFSDYPELRQLSWHVPELDHLSPEEAHNIYERNQRYIDKSTLSAHETHLIKTLQKMFDGLDI
jgi:transcriptional regulator with XRE-family HTH domain